jgi:flagellar basal-body rod modification protein FlgD
MQIAGITDGYGPVAGAAERDYSEVNKIDFMKLLVAQIQNQDPMSPMDNQQFTGQITQFSMLEQMEKTNANLEESLIVGQAINNTSMLGLVGKKVTVEGDKTTVAAGVPSENMLTSELPGTATVEVKDATGRVVATYDKPVGSGLNDVSWNGKLAGGEIAGDGQYTLSVSLKNPGGTELPFKTLMTGAVDGLRYENNQAVVMVGGLEFYVSEIYKVS